MEWNDKIVAWYDYQNRSHEWRLAQSEEEFAEIKEAAEKRCESFFGVMVFDTKDVKNKGLEHLEPKKPSEDTSVVYLKLEEFNDDFECKCGNVASTDGFYPCNEAGVYTEPTPDWEGYYKCARCKQIYFITEVSE